MSKKMFEVRDTIIPGCYELVPQTRPDSRGKFVKTFHADFFDDIGIDPSFREHFYTVSHKGVLRGLHFQTPPSDHGKLVFVTAGIVLDVVTDVRIGSPAYGKHVVFELTARRANQVYMPSGCAHGFYTVSRSSTMVYNVTSVYDPERDTGIRWDSVGINWPDATPLISERDSCLPPFSEFESPFAFDISATHPRSK